MPRYYYYSDPDKRLLRETFDDWGPMVIQRGKDTVFKQWQRYKKESQCRGYIRKDGSVLVQEIDGKDSWGML